MLVVTNVRTTDIALPRNIVETLKKQQYYIAGNHSAAKLCTYTIKSLKNEDVCYKETFYGIRAHQCLQSTPSVSWCTHRCQFCWRSESWEMGQEMNNIPLDPPEVVAEELIKAQRKLLNGYKGNPKVPKEKWEEAYNPKHVAISLSGEPTLYPYLGELIEIFHKKNMTTFLVTNGTQPEALENLNPLPTQLYVTIPAPDYETYKKTVRPFNPEKSWNALMKTLELFPSLNTRKVVRLTLVKNLNMHNPKGYQELFLKTQAHFLEAKGFVSVGSARKLLGYERMPHIEDIRSFAEQIIEGTDLQIIDEKAESSVVLIAKEDYPWRKFKFN